MVAFCTERALSIPMYAVRIECSGGDAAEAKKEEVKVPHCSHYSGLCARGGALRKLEKSSSSNTSFALIEQTYPEIE